MNTLILSLIKINTYSLPNISSKILINSVYVITNKIAHIRSIFWGLLLKSIGENVIIQKGCVFGQPHEIEIGNNVFINKNVMFLNSQEAGIKLGDFVIIGPNVVFITDSIDYRNITKPMCYSHKFHKSIEVGSDVWIGTNAVILPGVKIGKGSIVGAGAVVTKDVSPFTVVAGVPAKVIKYRTGNKNN